MPRICQQRIRGNQLQVESKEMSEFWLRELDQGNFIASFCLLAHPFSAHCVDISAEVTLCASVSFHVLPMAREGGFKG